MSLVKNLQDVRFNVELESKFEALIEASIRAMNHEALDKFPLIASGLGRKR